MYYEVMYLLSVSDKGPHDLLFDEEQFRSNVFQRPFNCLRDLDRRNTPKLLGPEDVSVRGNQAECLNTLIRFNYLHDYITKRARKKRMAYVK